MVAWKIESRRAHLNQRRAVAVMLMLVCFLGVSPEYRADTLLVPFSYCVSSSNGQYVFVMRAPVGVENDALGQPPEKRDEALRLRSKYPASGLYLNDGSTKPLWAVDWYATRVKISSDGNNLVRYSLWASSRSDEALSFFVNGQAKATYRVGELIDVTWVLPRTISNFEWGKDLILDDEKKSLTVTTLTYDRYVFDIASGEMISARRLIRAATFVFLLLPISVLIIFMRRRRHITSGRRAR